MERVVNEHQSKNTTSDTSHIAPYCEKKAYSAIKRCMGFTIAVVALIVLLPLFMLISIVIYIDDPSGSPFYTQIRCGRHKKPFKLYKFRTMRVNAEALLEDLRSKNEMDGHVFKIKDDPRITRIGRFFRKTSLDELPQLVNVFLGNMCIVGPRPPLPAEVTKYNSYQERRLDVTPGLTCYWQTYPDRNSVKFDDWVEMDLRYIRERSLWVDLKLILKTIRVMIRCEGQ